MMLSLHYIMCCVLTEREYQQAYLLYYDAYIFPGGLIKCTKTEREREILDLYLFIIKKNNKILNLSLLLTMY